MVFSNERFPTLFTVVSFWLVHVSLGRSFGEGSLGGGGWGRLKGGGESLWSDIAVTLNDVGNTVST